MNGIERSKEIFYETREIGGENLFNSISDELVLQIFQYLSFIDRHKAAFVDRRFNAIANDKSLKNAKIESFLRSNPLIFKMSNVLAGTTHFLEVKDDKILWGFQSLYADLEGNFVVVALKEIYQGAIEVWDLESGKEAAKITTDEIPSKVKFSLKNSKVGPQLAASFLSGELFVWNYLNKADKPERVIKALDLNNLDLMLYS